MPSHIFDSLIYGSAWGTAETRALFDDMPRTRAWLEILAVLADTQAAVGLIPEAAAHDVARVCRELPIDAAFLDEVRRGYEATGHSTLGLIKAVQRHCPGTSGEWLCYGATVQDLADTWMAGALVTMAAIVRRDLIAVEANLLKLAGQHRDTVMVGRTHGQPGLTITFGFKVAAWASEVRRHVHRLGELTQRLGVGQLAGGVGSLSSLGPRGLELQKEFLARLRLRAPDIAWTSTRDVVVEWFQVSTLIAGTFDRIAHEVYNLQRPEIGEVSEGFTPGTVGSITMPHKRNPEGSEHVDTLARLARANAAVLTEGMVAAHERDGRAWKAEWVALPEVCLLTGAALGMTERLLSGLVVDAEAMRANLDSHGDRLASEQMLAGVTRRLGRHAAQRLMHDVLAPGSRDIHDVFDALVADGVATEQDREPWTTWQVGDAGRMVDEVVARARNARSLESGPWA
jgi:adenylosuccinate lyase